MVSVWVFRADISEWLLGDSLYKNEVGLIGFAILLTLIGTAHTALLQGMRSIDDLGRVTVYSALIGTIGGLAGIWFLGESGLVWFLVIQPLATTIIASKYTKRLPISKKNILGANEVWDIWKPMVKLGAAFMLGGLVTSVTMIIVRQRIIQELGLDAAGLFAAAWGISMIYIGLMLSAVSADYYPRLTEMITDRNAATKLMNDQLQIFFQLVGQFCYC